MKRILLTSTALVAFAGAAAAEVTWSGDAEVGYNDKAEDGFYFEAGLGIKASAELNNGLEAGFKFDVDVTMDRNDNADADDGTWDNIEFDASDYELYLKSETAGMYFGDTKPAFEKVLEGKFNSMIEGNTFMMAETFIEDGDVDDGAAKGDYVDGIVRVEGSIAGMTAAVSGLVYEDAEGEEKIGGMQLALDGSFGAYSFGLGFQQEDTDVMVDGANSNVDEIFALYVGGTFGGADVRLAHVANNSDEVDSTAIQVAYPFGPVKAAVFYSFEEEDDTVGLELEYASGPAQVNFWYYDGGIEEVGLEGHYDFSNGLVVKAGYIETGDADGEGYVGAEYDLGGGASLVASYSEGDEIGRPEYKEGTTVAVSFEF